MSNIENFFFSHCTKNPNVFNSMFQLKSKADETKDTIEDLKSIRKGQRKDRIEQLQEEKKD